MTDRRSFYFQASRPPGETFRTRRGGEGSRATMAKRTVPIQEAGFSIIEVLVVLVIVSILAAIAIVSMATAFDRAKQRTTMSDMRTLSKAIEIYQADTGFYPSSGQTISQLATFLIPVQSSVIPQEDAWHHAFVYSTDDLNSYSIESYGKDGVNGVQIDYANRFEFDLDLVVSNGIFTASPEP